MLILIGTFMAGLAVGGALVMEGTRRIHNDMKRKCLLANEAHQISIAFNFQDKVRAAITEVRV